MTIILECYQNVLFSYISLQSDKQLCWKVETFTLGCTHVNNDCRGLKKKLCIVRNTTTHDCCCNYPYYFKILTHVPDPDATNGICHMSMSFCKY